MAAADHDDVEVFHVKHPSLADAEAGEDLAQKVFDIDPADQRIQRPDRLPQIFRRQFDARVAPLPTSRRADLPEPRSRARIATRCRSRIKVPRRAARAAPDRADTAAISSVNARAGHARNGQGQIGPICVGLALQPQDRRPAAPSPASPPPSSRNTRRSAASARSSARVDPDAFQPIAGVAQARRVQQGHRQPGKVHPHLDHIARRAGDLRGDRRLTPRQALRSVDFPAFGAPTMATSNPSRIRSAAAHPRRLAPKVGQQPVDQRQHFGRDIDRHVLVGEVDGRFEQGRRADQVAPPAVDPLPDRRRTAPAPPAAAAPRSRRRSGRPALRPAPGPARRSPARAG